jgi:hypothetical protein
MLRAIKTTFSPAMIKSAAAGVATIAIAFLLVPSSEAQISKCLDSSGKVVGYGTSCPPGTRSEQTGIRNAPSSSAPSASRGLAEQEAEFRKRQVEKQDAQKKAERKAADREARSEACESAQSYLQTLESGMRVMRTNPATGEREFLSDEQRTSEIARARKQIGSSCK